MREEN